MFDFFNDDKNLVIVAATLLGLCCLFTLDSPENIVNVIVTGLFGVAVGKNMQ
jgi:hypothetical protein